MGSAALVGSNAPMRLFRCFRTVLRGVDEGDRDPDERVDVVLGNVDVVLPCRPGLEAKVSSERELREFREFLESRASRESEVVYESRLEYCISPFLNLRPKLRPGVLCNRGC